MLINKVNLLSFCLSSQSKKTFLEILVNSSSDKTNVKLGLFMFETETSASPEPDDVWHSMLTKGRKHDTHWMISTCGTIFLTWMKMVDTYRNAPLCVFKVQQHTVLLPQTWMNLPLIMSPNMCFLFQENPRGNYMFATCLTIIFEAHFTCTWQVKTDVSYMKPAWVTAVCFLSAWSLQKIWKHISPGL